MAHKCNDVDRDKQVSSPMCPTHPTNRQSVAWLVESVTSRFIISEDADLLLVSSASKFPRHANLQFRLGQVRESTGLRKADSPGHRIAECNYGLLHATGGPERMKRKWKPKSRGAQGRPRSLHRRRGITSQDPTNSGLRERIIFAKSLNNVMRNSILQQSIDEDLFAEVELIEST